MTCTLPSAVAILYTTFGVCSMTIPFQTLPSAVWTTSRYAAERTSISASAARACEDDATTKSSAAKTVIFMEPSVSDWLDVVFMALRYKRCLVGFRHAGARALEIH